MASEFDAMKVIDEALVSLSDDERGRVLQWVGTKYGQVAQNIVRPIGVGARNMESRPMSSGTGEIPGIARLGSDGSFKLTVRDVKAKSTNDAAIRLVHVVVLAHELLTNEPSVSSKKILVPVLREWRAYSGNTRALIATHKGIIREGDMISLDAHARQEAEEYIRQIQDDTVQGSWKPAAVKGKSKAHRAVKPQ